MFVLAVAGNVRAADGDVPLVDAIRRHDREAVRALLARKTDVNVRTGDGATALHWAAHQDDLEAADLLIKAGARAEVANDYGVTPLSLACVNRNAAMVERLLKAGANPNAAQTTGETVLITCSRTGTAAGVRALISYGAKVDAREHWNEQTAIMGAAAHGHADVVKVLIEGGADTRARSAPNVRLVATTTGGRNAVPMPRGGFTPFLFAARSGDIESARVLLEAGTPVDDAAPDGNTALVIASHSGHTPLAAFLLDRGADPNLGGAGYTALHVAVLRGDISLVKVLLQHGANPNVALNAGTPVQRFGQDYVLNSELIGASPFFLAAKFLEIELMRVLAAAGANPVATTYEGVTPLMATAGYGWGGNEDRRGRVMTPAEIAAEREDDNGVLEAVKLAVQLGGDVHGTNNLGDTALHASAAQGFPAAIRFLVGAGAPVDVKNYKNETPMALTKIRDQVGRVVGELKTAQALRELGAKEVPNQDGPGKQ